jgi:hypothetical protein
MILCVAIFAVAVPSAAQAQDTIRNPSGSCGTRRDGARAGYHSPGNALWVPDCQNPLRREYWRVFVTPGGEAFVMPRPDGAPELQAICAGHDEMRVVVDRYGLCTVARSSEQVRIVNTMNLSDALRITHFLNGRLEFSVVVEPGEPAYVRPYAIPSDVVDACAIRPDTTSAGLAAYCGSAPYRHEFPFFANPVVAEALAARLNELYGIK